MLEKAQAKEMDISVEAAKGRFSPLVSEFEFAADQLPRCRDYFYRGTLRHTVSDGGEGARATVSTQREGDAKSTIKDTSDNVASVAAPL
ncbi:hypothetical protein H8B02_04380 [Bradyrhizobium sp. Pear77]|uniref:hypothetical protein n=1 Tax=Bradyrhizobium altum TaxID=1571202 RepID=UPI001E28C14C|nr:hypothetical protein [Bradyrhizobium altum]MCC8952731.1 hypothetical protein [Bradyrhizobium altum]